MPTPDKGPEVAALVAELHRRKSIEDAARLARIAAEERIIQALGEDITTGSRTFRATDAAGTRAKFRVEQPITAKVDADAWWRVSRQLPEAHPGRACIRLKYDLATGEAKKLQASDPQAWADIAPAITRKPGKPAVRVVSIEHEEANA